MAWGLEVEYDEKAAKLEQLVAIPKFKTSPDMLRALIFKRHETKEIHRFSLEDPLDSALWSSEDTISVDKGALLTLFVDPATPPDLKEIIGLYWDAEHVWKQRSTFVASDLVNHAIGRDGRLRPGWNALGTDTMRWSCSEPNVMNVVQWLRCIYGAKPGCVLVHADKSQAELRMMEAISGDPELKRRLDTGDVYTEDAKDWFGLPKHFTKKEVKPDARKAAKILHLGSQYGAGLATVYKQALVQDRTTKWATAANLFKCFYASYAATVTWWGEELERVRKTGYSEGRILGGRRYYPRDPPPTETNNYPCQRTVGEMMNLETVAVHRRLKSDVPSARLVIQLHDAVDVEVPERHAGKVERILTEEMDTEYTIEGRTRRFPIEIKQGRHWDEV
jgi:DNA polymerase-1